MGEPNDIARIMRFSGGAATSGGPGRRQKRRRHIILGVRNAAIIRNESVSPDSLPEEGAAEV